MDNWKNYIAMMTGSGSKKHCCAPLFGSLDCITWLQTGSPSNKVFMTFGIDVDQNRIYLERKLCSSSLSRMLLNENGRRADSCLPSSDSQMNLVQNWNGNKKICQTERLVLNAFKRYHCTIHQSCLDTTVLISIALIQENLFAVVSMDQRLI